MPPSILSVTRGASLVAAAAPFFLAQFVYFDTYLLIGYYVAISMLFCLPQLKKYGPISRIVLGGIVVAGAGAALYYGWNYIAFAESAGRVIPLYVWLGVICTAGALVVSRIGLGWPLPLIAVLLILSNYAAPWLPGFLHHAGFSADRLVLNIYSDNGIFGSAASAFTNFVILFVIFGGMLEQIGIVGSVTRLAERLFGQTRGRNAKASIMSSAVLGSVIGAGPANIAMTGPITIPAMKREGFKGSTAGAIETIASMGGNVLPPVMGAGAFVMAQFAGVSYATVVTMALLPGVIYYVSLYAYTHFYIAKHAAEIRIPERNVERLNAEDFLPLVPIVTLVALFLLGLPEREAAMYGIFMCGGIMVWQTRSASDAVKRFVAGIESGFQMNSTIGAAAGAIGIVIAMLNIAGLTVVFSMSMLDWAGGNLLILLGLVAIVSIVMGMGMTATACYVIVSVLAAPLMVRLGVPLLSAHLIVFWFSIISAITPPVAIGSFIAASIAKESLMRTSLESLKFGQAMFFIPLAMAFTPLMSDVLSLRLASAVICALAVVSIAAGVLGRFNGRLNLAVRALLIGLGYAILLPYGGEIYGLPASQAVCGIMMLAFFAFRLAIPAKDGRDIVPVSLDR